VPTWFEDWLEAEREAHTLRLWSPILIRGLLPTAEYARALFPGAGADDVQAEQMVVARLERQAILDRQDSPSHGRGSRRGGTALDPDGPKLAFTEEAWSEFVQGITRGEFDL
jgi:hypothetical protein